MGLWPPPGNAQNSAADGYRVLEERVKPKCGDDSQTLLVLHFKRLHNYRKKSSLLSQTTKKVIELKSVHLS